MPTSDEQPAIVIRDRQDADIDPIVTLALESLTWHADTFPNIRPAPSRDALLADFREITEAPNSYFRVAELDTAVVGYLSAGLHPATTSGTEALDEPSVYISDVIVTSTARRRGIARALLTDLEQWATERACHTIRLNMHTGNQPAQQLYEQLDYQASWITFRKDITQQ